VRILFLLPGLLILLGCDSGLDSDDFELRLNSLNKINSKLLTFDNLDTLNVSNSLTTVRGILGEDTLEFHDLVSELLLRDIKYYQLGGLEYYFGNGTRGDYEYYMLYTINLDKKAEFTHYEQYRDFAFSRKDVDDRWTFVKKKEGN